MLFVLSIRLSLLDSFTRELLLCRRGAMAAHHLPTFMGYLLVRQVGVAGSTPVDGTRIIYCQGLDARLFFHCVPHIHHPLSHIDLLVLY